MWLYLPRRYAESWWSLIPKHTEVSGIRGRMSGGYRHAQGWDWCGFSVLSSSVLQWRKCFDQKHMDVFVFPVVAKDEFLSFHFIHYSLQVAYDPITIILTIAQLNTASTGSYTTNNINLIILANYISFLGRPPY